MDINRFQFYADGPGQMQHFVKKHGMNVFRLPVAWQFLVNYKVGGPLNAKNFGLYDDLVQACLKTGSYCMIDIHNYGLYDGKIVGQGGPTNQQFASLWWQLGSKYRKQKKVMMGLMNEPHDCMRIGGVHLDWLRLICILQWTWTNGLLLCKRL